MSGLENVPKPLWGRVMAFNLTHQADPSYLAAALKPLDVMRVKNEFLLSKAAARSLKRLPRFYDFSTPFRRLALLPRQKLWQLILYAGTALHNEGLRRVIDAARVKTLRQSLGAAYTFALRASPLLAPPPPSSPLPNSAAGFAADGHKLLVTAAVNEPLTLQKLWALRFPPSLEWAATAADEQFTVRAAAFLVRVGGQVGD